MEIKETLPNLLVTRDGHVDDEYYSVMWREQRKAALRHVGVRTVELASRPLRNFSLNMLDLVREHSLLAK